MKRYINRLPIILIYSFCLVGISLFWINFAEALFFDTGWWKEFRVPGSIMLYGIILFSISWVVEELGLTNFLLELSIEFGVFIVLYLIFGYIFHWYSIKNWWAMPLQCIPVFIAVYLFRFHRINKDIDFINTQLQHSCSPKDE